MDDLHIPRAGKVKQFLFHWDRGRQDNFPICCIFRFAWAMALFDGKTIPDGEGFAEKRGIVDDGTRDVFVPCNLFHHKTEDI